MAKAHGLRAPNGLTPAAARAWTTRRALLRRITEPTNASSPPTRRPERAQAHSARPSQPIGALVLAGLCALAGVAPGCGGGDATQPLAVEIQGLSARADVLVVKLIGRSTGQTCAGVSLTTAPQVSASHTAQWVRSAMDERRLELPVLPEPSMTIIAYALDAASTPIQFLCHEVTFDAVTNLPEDVLFLTLSVRAGAT